MAVVSNGTTLIDAGAVSAASGSMTHIKTLTASSSATLSFVHGAADVVLDSTYNEYVFKFINIHASAASEFEVGFRDGDSAYDATKTTTAFYAYHMENDSNTTLIINAAEDLAQSTAFQNLTIAGQIGLDNDECASGHMTLYNPSSTTFVKHFMSETNYVSNDGIVIGVNTRISGYCNVTAAIDGVQFKMGSGNIDSGEIKLYGIGG
tara:strand:- start:547 stop:1167 length:621 start_codon:yes stop_codon:yes gene_type:complete